MDKVEKIKAYIEKRKKENILTSEARFEEDVDILSAINSLPKIMDILYCSLGLVIGSALGYCLARVTYKPHKKEE